MTHPTLLELDALHLGDSAGVVRAHVEQCDECGGYLQTLQQPVALPQWLDQARTPAWRRWLAPAVGLPVSAALAAVLLVVVSAQLTMAPIRSKGLPAVAVYARHGDRIELWDGRTPFQADDAIRFEVLSESLGRVTVASIEPDGALKVLHEGSVELGHRAALPFSLTFDAAPGAESVVVVLSANPLSPHELGAAASRQPRSSTLWATRFVFPKR